MTKRSPSIDRAVRIELRARPSSANPRPRASPAPAASWSRPRSSRPAARWHRAMRHAGPCRPSAWRAVIHWSARRCPPCSCGRQALSPVESRGGRAGGLAAVENLAGSERQGPGRALSSHVLHPPSLEERHPGNRMAFLLACLRAVAVCRASGSARMTAPRLRVPAGCRSPRCLPRRSAGRPSRPPCLEVPLQDAGGAGLGRGGDCCRRWAASRPGRRACWCRRSR